MSTIDPVRAIADAVLYEGYVLWPYRRSALKNTRRWTFGGVYPRAHSERHPDDSWRMRSEMLVEGPGDAHVQVSVRFLHVVHRQVARLGADDVLEPVDELVVDGERHLSWDEATERELHLPPLPLDELEQSFCVPVDIGEGSQCQTLGGGEGVILHSWRALAGTLEVQSEELRPGVFRLRVEVANTTPFCDATRDEALERTFCSTHAVVHTGGASLVSLTDPPEALRDLADGCRNDGVWPVLVGEPGSHDTVLASPIILEDHPRIAPESPGDLYDGGEIDQMLTLNILALTDEEKAEMRDSDPRVRAILERTEALTPDELARMNGAIRDFRQVR